MAQMAVPKMCRNACQCQVYRGDHLLAQPPWMAAECRSPCRCFYLPANPPGRGPSRRLGILLAALPVTKILTQPSNILHTYITYSKIELRIIFQGSSLHLYIGILNVQISSIFYTGQNLCVESNLSAKTVLDINLEI